MLPAAAPPVAANNKKHKHFAQTFILQPLLVLLLLTPPQWRIQDYAKGGRSRQGHENTEGVIGRDTPLPKFRKFSLGTLHFDAFSQSFDEFLIYIL